MEKRTFDSRTAVKGSGKLFIFEKYFVFKTIF